MSKAADKEQPLAPSKARARLVGFVQRRNDRGFAATDRLSDISFVISRRTPDGVDRAGERQLGLAVTLGIRANCRISGQLIFPLQSDKMHVHRIKNDPNSRVEATDT